VKRLFYFSPTKDEGNLHPFLKNIQVASFHSRSHPPCYDAFYCISCITTLRYYLYIGWSILLSRTYFSCCFFHSPFSHTIGNSLNRDHHCTYFFLVLCCISVKHVFTIEGGILQSLGYPLRESLSMNGGISALVKVPHSTDRTWNIQGILQMVLAFETYILCWREILRSHVSSHDGQISRWR